MKPNVYSLTCPLCGGGSELYHQDRFREYHCCSNCSLVFVPQRFHLSSEDEKALYDLHENSCHDAGYLHFLSRLTTPLLGRLQGPSKGLDFGCGPGPVLGSILSKHGHTVLQYDPYYFDDQSVLSGKYDFVCTSEVVEHLRCPGVEFSLLFQLLKRGGWLAIMTKMVRDRKAFKTWHYIRDPTHIAFYHEDTFLWLAAEYGAELSVLGPDVIFLQVF